VFSKAKYRLKTGDIIDRSDRSDGVATTGAGKNPVSTKPSKWCHQ